ncbi:MAG: aldose 1-epimerase [Solirubrobacterales bacterium]|nr:aldose 1-epimerase [Solirubrobacterales bacterium]
MTPRQLHGFDANTLSAGELEAVFVPGAGMIGASLRHRGEELLGQRAGLRAYAESGKTMGIPLLHPWANRLSGDDFRAGTDRVDLPPEAPGMRREENGLPIHGLLAGSPDWRVTCAEPTRLTASLDFAARPERLALFPFPHTLTVTATLDPGVLRVETRLAATGVASVPISFGWHPYLQLPGIPRAQWTVELPARRHLLTDDRGIPTGQTEPAPPRTGPLGEATFDDGYDELAEPLMVLRGGGRRLGVRLVAGYPFTQVFAPLEHDLVAFEPMTAPTDALRSGRRLRTVPPGEAFAATFAIEVSKE